MDWMQPAKNRSKSRALKKNLPVPRKKEENFFTSRVAIPFSSPWN